MRPENKAQRIHITIPIELLAWIDRYRKENAIPHRTTAIMELVRKGLKEELK